MKEPMPTLLLNKDGKPVRVKKIPMSTGKRKFKNATQADNERSPFERFSRSGGSRITSF